MGCLGKFWKALGKLEARSWRLYGFRKVPWKSLGRSREILGEILSILGSPGEDLEEISGFLGRSWGVWGVLGGSEGPYRAAKVLHVDGEAITIACS